MNPTSGQVLGGSGIERGDRWNEGHGRADRGDPPMTIYVVYALNV